MFPGDFPGALDTAAPVWYGIDMRGKREPQTRTWKYNPEDYRGGTLMIVKLRFWSFGRWPLSFGKAFDLGKLRFIWNIDSVKHAESYAMLLALHERYEAGMTVGGEELV